MLAEPSNCWQIKQCFESCFSVAPHSQRCTLSVRPVTNATKQIIVIMRAAFRVFLNKLHMLVWLYEYYKSFANSKKFHNFFFMPKYKEAIFVFIKIEDFSALLQGSFLEIYVASLYIPF